MALKSDLTENEIKALLDICAEAPGDTYMEIGVYAGGTMARVMENYQFFNYIGVDMFDGFVKSPDNTHVDETYTVDQIKEALPEKPGLQLIKTDSRHLLEHLNFQFAGVVFIDGNHTYNATLIDVLNAYILLSYGFIAIHNASNTMHPDVNYVNADGGPYGVVEYLKKLPDLKYVGTFDRLAIFRK